MLPVVPVSSVTSHAWSQEPTDTLNNFLVETIWAMCTYGARHLAWGLVHSSVIVIWASRRMRLGMRMALLVAATATLGFKMFMPADSGYRAWQGISNPPDEAFSDTGPIPFLLPGWIPGSGITYLLLRPCQRMFPRPPAAPPGRPPIRT